MWCVSANDINDLGSIVGFTWNPQTSTWGVYLLAPVPEPQIYLMLLVGLGLVGFIARGRAITLSHGL